MKNCVKIHWTYLQQKEILKEPFFIQTRAQLIFLQNSRKRLSHLEWFKAVLQEESAGIMHQWKVQTNNKNWMSLQQVWEVKVQEQTDSHWWSRSWNCAIYWILQQRETKAVSGRIITGTVSGTESERDISDGHKRLTEIRVFAIIKSVTILEQRKSILSLKRLQ